MTKEDGGEGSGGEKRSRVERRRIIFFIMPVCLLSFLLAWRGRTVLQSTFSLHLKFFGFYGNNAFYYYSFKLGDSSTPAFQTANKQKTTTKQAKNKPTSNSSCLWLCGKCCLLLDTSKWKYILNHNLKSST